MTYNERRLMSLTALETGKSKSTVLMSAQHLVMALLLPHSVVSHDNTDQISSRLIMFLMLGQSDGFMRKRGPDELGSVSRTHSGRKHVVCVDPH